MLVQSFVPKVPFINNKLCEKKTKVNKHKTNERISYNNNYIFKYHKDKKRLSRKWSTIELK
jgi:hypothetical protein